MTYKDSIRFFHRYGGLQGSFDDLYGTEPSTGDLEQAVCYSVTYKGKPINKAIRAAETVMNYWDLQDAPSVADFIVAGENG